MGKQTVLSLLFIFILTGYPQIPLPAAPDWSSIDNDYSTGGAFADIDGNGFLDFCISNGNDMAYNYNSVYLNTGGILENRASWRSNDSGYFGHCYIGDVNNDGLPDLAVGYLGSGTSGDFRARVYLNTGSGLGPAPWWRSADRHASFDCCLGDFDLDGDLDLAISAGDAYAPDGDSVRIYRNNGGVFDSLPCWTAEESVPSDAIRFCDIDNDGDLDLFVGHRRKVVMYENQNGVLATRPSWVARQGIGWVLRLEFGDYDRDGFLDLAVASNDQLGDPNSIKVFHNNNGVLDTIARFNMQRRGTQNYSSCVAWGDVNGDGYPELAAGGWWKPVRVYANNNGVLDTLPAWQWQPSNPNYLVCEALIWADVRNHQLRVVTESRSGDGYRKLFYLGHRPAQFLDSIKVNGVAVTPADYCCDLGAGWISFARAPDSGNGNVIFYYRYPEYPDLAVTNWDRSNGNHLFLNTTQVGVAEAGSTSRLSVAVMPNPAAGPITIRFDKILSREIPVSIYSRDGRLVRRLITQNGVVVWDGSLDDGRPAVSGVYMIQAAGVVPVKLVWLGR
ncbi:MAG: T9SS type A sorting domain-containing protein [candidate division WOR-3 bacterium]|uniref:T9SS type A sorting domain-containing protein n=2 Tax=candidate division WOR-3 bacterium TaxID=2052148 RepID=A0A7C1SCN2_UNCW3|nr:T9SS type A sorting domain-containing protein [candidate division WOR-3 bacterium]